MRISNELQKQLHPHLIPLPSRERKNEHKGIMISKDKNTIVLVNRPEKHFATSFYFKNIKAGIDLALEGTNYIEFFAQQDENLADIMSSKKQKIAGVIAIHPNVNDKSIKILEKESGVYSVLINCRSNKLTWVDLDNVSGALTMTEHLI